MKKFVYMICLFQIMSTSGMIGYIGVMQSKQNLNQELFEGSKKHLSPQLKDFVDDFATWPTQEKNKLEIKFTTNNILFYFHDLNQTIQTRYDGNLEIWLDKQALIPREKLNLASCLEYLK